MKNILIVAVVVAVVLIAIGAAAIILLAPQPSTETGAPAADNLHPGEGNMLGVFENFPGNDPAIGQPPAPPS